MVICRGCGLRRSWRRIADRGGDHQRRTAARQRLTLGPISGQGPARPDQRSPATWLGLTTCGLASCGSGSVDRLSSQEVDHSVGDGRTAASMRMPRRRGCPTSGATADVLTYYGCTRGAIRGAKCGSAGWLEPPPGSSFRPEGRRRARVRCRGSSSVSCLSFCAFLAEPTLAGRPIGHDAASKYRRHRSKVSHAL